MSAMGWPAVLLSVSESIFGSAAEVKLQVNCVGVQLAQASHMRTAKVMFRNVPPQM